MPKVVVHNPVLAYEIGAEFMQAWWDAEAGKLDPSCSSSRARSRTRTSAARATGPRWATTPTTGQPITTNEWLDRLAPKAAAVVALGTCATYGGIPAMKNNPTGAMGVADHLGWNWKSSAGLPVVNIPGCPAQPDNIDRDAALPGAAPRRAGAGAGPRRGAAARSGCSGEPCARAATAPASPSRATSRPSTATTPAAWSSSAARARWSSATSRFAAGSTATAAARTWAGSAWPARCPASPTSTCRSWTRTHAGGAGGEHHAVHLWARSLRYFRNRNIRNKYDNEPEWRKPRNELHRVRADAATRRS